MDPVSVFNALHDTKCIKFGRYDLKSGLVAPYYINLRRLPLYPALMEAVVAQVIEKFLTNQTLRLTMSQLGAQLGQGRSRNSSVASRTIKASLVSSISAELERQKQMAAGDQSTDSDSQLGEDLETCSDDCDDWEPAASCPLDPVISGVPYGAIPIAAAIAFKSRLPYLFERKGVKLYGDHQPLIEDFNQETRTVYPAARRDSFAGVKLVQDGVTGMDLGGRQQQQQQPRQQVILIEDVICSGESILGTVQQLEQQGLKVEFVICIIDREENGINLLLEHAGIHVVSLYKISAILRVLETTGRISSKQFVSTRKWIDENQFKTIGVDPNQPTTPTPGKVAALIHSNGAVATSRTVQLI